MLVTVGLIGWRGDRLRSPGRIDSPLSREGAFLANNLLFAAFAFVVLLGTVFPLIVEAVRGDQLSVGEPYFNRMTMPIGLALLFLMAVAPALPWRKASAETLSHAAGLAGVDRRRRARVRGAGRAPGASPRCWPSASAGSPAARRCARSCWPPAARAGAGWSGRTNGGMVVHLGVVLIAVAFAASSSYAHQRELLLDPGERARVGTHTVEYLGLVTRADDAKTERVARVRIDDGPVYAPVLQRFPRGRRARSAARRCASGRSTTCTSR